MKRSEEFAVIIMPGDGRPQVWPTRGRGTAEFEAFCADMGATLVQVYGSLEEATCAAKAIDAPAEEV